MKLLLVVGLLALLVYWYYSRRRNAGSTPDRDSTSGKSARHLGKTGSQYHAVSIRTGRRTCKAVRKYSGLRILASEAPQLPLPDCDVAQCECSFVHYTDRRSGKDRRSPFGAGGMSVITGKYEQERRSGKDRRVDDDDEFNQ